MSNGFGLIHDLAKLESDVRRELGAAKHNIHTAKSILEFDSFNRDTVHQLKKLLGEAMESLAKVAGD